MDYKTFESYIELQPISYFMTIAEVTEFIYVVIYDKSWYENDF